MKKWQYYTTYDIDTNRMDQLGIEGWELVSVVTYDYKPAITTFYFKRELIN